MFFLKSQYGMEIVKIPGLKQDRSEQESNCAEFLAGLCTERGYVCSWLSGCSGDIIKAVCTFSI